MAEVVIAVIAVVGGIVAIAVILAWLKGYDEGYEDGYAQQKLNRIWETLSIIDAEPVKHGEWEDVKFSEGVYKDNDDSNDIGLSITSAKCSLCQRYSERLQQYRPKMPAYCSHCGARMDGGAK